MRISKMFFQRMFLSVTLLTDITRICPDTFMNSRNMHSKVR
ncbi:unnamed protein product [Schistosoma margrebowiei]|uniref:Uncharacterized protein n=1 Tax=Schistosoma margrebowiei TaxID=48269 RepID=A0A183M6P7_9TREM|nr:unnamed protein product [Schistosoma margrebowiei]